MTHLFIRLPNELSYHIMTFLPCFSLSPQILQTHKTRLRILHRLTLNTGVYNNYHVFKTIMQRPDHQLYSPFVIETDSIYIWFQLGDQHSQDSYVVIHY